MTLEVAPQIQPGQRGLVLLNQLQDEPSKAAHAFTLDFLLDAPQQDGEIEVKLPDDLPAGKYLVRVRVDGGESLLFKDPEPAQDEKPETDSGRYACPIVEIADPNRSVD